MGINLRLRYPTHSGTRYRKYYEDEEGDSGIEDTPSE